MRRQRIKRDPATIFLTKRQHEILEAVRKRDNIRWLAADDLGMTEQAIISSLSRVRLKLDAAIVVRKRYGKILKRQR